MNFCIFSFLLILQCKWISAKLDNCTHHLHRLASDQKDFVQCSTLNAVPVSLCIGCEPKYTQMIVSYDVLLNDKNCTDKYFDKDRINIVSTTQSILTGLWYRAFCDDCFTSNNFIVFDNKSMELESCFRTNKGNECTDCFVYYDDLNKFYTNLTKHNNGKICYDMQDSMNRTRSKWSKDFKCCKREFHQLLFLCVMGLVAILPVAFYGGSYAYTKRRERNHDILNADAEFHTTSTQHIPQEFQAPTQTQRAPSTSSGYTSCESPRKIIPKAIDSSKNIIGNSDSDDDDDDDDDMIVGVEKQKKH